MTLIIGVKECYYGYFKNTQETETSKDVEASRAQGLEE